MEREQTTIRLPAELKEKLQQEAQEFVDRRPGQFKDVELAKRIHIRYALGEIEQNQ